jgi:hypothetical protein
LKDKKECNLNNKQKWLEKKNVKDTNQPNDDFQKHAS